MSLPETLIKKETKAIEYDANGRMKYHRDFHQKQSHPWTTEDLEYLCKYYKVDGLKTISFALERTEMTVATKIHELRKSKLFNYYKNLNRFW